MRFDILTLFPEMFEPFKAAGVIGRAQDAGSMDLNTHNIRDFTTDKHGTVDDTPYGGGAGMVMKVEPIDKTLKYVEKEFKGEKRKVVVLSARGEKFTQKKAHEYAKLDQLVLICGRYEGIDQRVTDNLADEEISIGSYVLAGGEVAAMVVMEAVTRLIPGVLGNPDSLKEESFSTTDADETDKQDLVEYPQYTKPEDYKGWRVPEILLSGDHGKIKNWRDEQSHRNV